ncbi:MAG: alpha-glucosidase [Alphaproteobacteria bacterium]|nr:MAG: alpha-glucosidase [Alphaproteobacteria bacterium]
MIGRLLMAVVLWLAGPAAAATVGVLDSPGRVLQVTLAIDNDGRATWAVARKGVAVVAPSRLGFLFVDGPKFERNLVAGRPVFARADATWEQPWGERRFVRDDHAEMRVRLTEKGSLGAGVKARRIDVVFKAFDDGVGFRYEFPDAGAVQIADELTEFNFAAPATAWWIPAGEWNRYEYLYNRTPLEAIGRAHTPVTLRTDAGLHIAVHEAALVDYAAMWLQHVDGRNFKAVLSPSWRAAKVLRQGPFASPWRALVIAPTAAALVESNLFLNLNEPNKLGDVSWVKPFKYAGVWWEMHLDTKTWASGDRHGATDANVRRHIDFAARNGFRGVLVEGWNLGWDGDWFGRGEDFSFTRSYPDFDLKGLADYAGDKGVRLVGHHETSGNAAHYEDALAAAFDLYAANGVDAVKTGYVADAGQAKVRDADGSLHYTWHDSQPMAAHHLKVVTEAAKRRIMVNAHEPIKDTGLRRTYPNWVSREGARGMEYNAWGQPRNPPGHDVDLVFTRMLAGPMDYTPGIVSLAGKGQALQSTVARQLALYVVLYSPVQMVPDLPENYAANPVALGFIRAVPVDWAESRMVAGEIGAHVSMARKDRGSDAWYVGSITDATARTVAVPLGFLDAGRRYRAEIIQDGTGFDWRTAPRAADKAGTIVSETREVTAADTMDLRLNAGGGAVVRLVPIS